MEHIDKFPTYESHYSRNQNPNMKYLGSELTISHMYSLYKEWCAQQKFNIVSKDKYFEVFGTNGNLGFSPPKSDTCKTCDGLTVKIQNCGPGDSNEIFFYENDLKLHREEANEGYKTITKMSKIAKEDPHKFDRHCSRFTAVTTKPKIIGWSGVLQKKTLDI